jgi:hypothetical protein
MDGGTMNSALIDLLNKRRDRAIAIILRTKEQECDRYLPPEQSAKLRKVVLDQVNNLSDMVVDLMGSLQDNSGVVLNEYYLQRLDDLHEMVSSLDGRL